MLEYVRLAAEVAPEAARIFLADGDFMALPFPLLRRVLQEINRRFPGVARITSYANGSSIAAKTDAELAELQDLKLAILYMGLESGDDELLRRLDKNEEAATMVAAVQRLQAAGMKASVMVLLGLGGQDGSERHIVATARVLNEMQPRLLSALRLIEVPGTSMPEGHRTISEYQSVCELRDLITGLKLQRTVFSANHTSVPFPVQGRLPHDRDRLVQLLNSLLESDRLDRNGPGRVPHFL